MITQIIDHSMSQYDMIHVSVSSEMASLWLPGTSWDTSVSRVRDMIQHRFHLVYSIKREKKEI